MPRLRSQIVFQSWFRQPASVPACPANLSGSLSQVSRRLYWRKVRDISFAVSSEPSARRRSRRNWVMVIPFSGAQQRLRDVGENGAHARLKL